MTVLVHVAFFRLSTLSSGCSPSARQMMGTLDSPNCLSFSLLEVSSDQLINVDMALYHRFSVPLKGRHLALKLSATATV